MIPPPSAAAQGMPFEGGPPHGLQTWIGLIRGGKPQIARQVLVALAVSWAPLAVLSALRGDFVGTDTRDSFVFDFGAQARFLLAVPLLILAEPVCVARLTAIVRQFVSSGLVPDSSSADYDRAVASTRRLMNSPLAELGAIMLAYGIVIAAVRAQAPANDLLSWHGALRQGHLLISPAGWWGALVSLPFLLMLLFGWLWRVSLWTRFLWLMGRLDLRLVPAHPDRNAGLKFLSCSLQALTPLGFVTGVIAGGAALNQVVHQSASPQQFAGLIVGVVTFVLVICAGPLFVFAPRLYREQKRGMFEYGGLSARMGEQLESKWLRGKELDSSALEVPDFSATTDLYSIAANVYGMWIAPLDLKSLGVLIGVTLLPFLPLLLLVAPFDVIVAQLAKLLF